MYLFIKFVGGGVLGGGVLGGVVLVVPVVSVVSVAPPWWLVSSWWPRGGWWWSGPRGAGGVLPGGCHPGVLPDGWRPRGGPVVAGIASWHPRPHIHSRAPWRVRTSLLSAAALALKNLPLRIFFNRLFLYLSII